MTPSSSLRSTFPSLRLQFNPFTPVPQIAKYEQKLQPLFCARDAEVEQVCRHAGQGGDAVFVNAPYGGGKTVTVLEALSRLRRVGAVTVYAQYERKLGFRQSLRDGMVAAGIPLEDGDHKIAIRSAVSRFVQKDTIIVLAMDDLDRAAEVSEIIEVTHDVRDVLSDGGSVVVTGQPFGVTFDLQTSAGGIFQKVDLPEFSQADFHEMLCKYLRSVHVDEGLSPTHPLHEQAAQFVCREVAAAKLTPRLFNFAMTELLHLAESKLLKNISIEFTLEHWSGLAGRIVRGLNPIQLKHIHAILKAGSVSEDTPAAINELGGSPLAEYPEVLQSVLQPLLEQNLLQSQSKGGKESFHVPSIVAGSLDQREREAGHPPAFFDDLAASLDACTVATTKKDKGKTLETFAVRFLSAVPGFTIPEDGERLRTDTEELDVVIEITDFRLHAKYGTLTICECKNWSKHVEGTELGTFRDKLRSRNCKFGIFISLGGVTPGFREKLKFYLTEGLVVALLTAEDFHRIRDRVLPFQILSDAYYATLKYKGA